MKPYMPPVRMILNGRPLILPVILVFVYCVLVGGIAFAKCSISDIRHDRENGPWLIRVPSSAAPSAQDEERFRRANSYLIHRLRSYTDYRKAINDGYGNPSMRLPPAIQSGVLVPFTRPINRPLADAPLGPSVLYYRGASTGLRLVGAGFIVYARQARDLDAILPLALANWHRIEGSCRPPGWDFYATFALRGNRLDWEWPGIDRYDVNPALRAW